MASDNGQRIIAIIADVLEIDPSEVRLQSHFFNDLGASSLDIAEMVWRIEDDKSFGVGEIPDEVLENIRCVQDVVDFIEGRQHTRSEELSAGPEVYQVAIASDHSGYPLKEVLRHFLEQRGVGVRDVGPDSLTQVDYPEHAEAVGHLVARGEAELGVLICTTGVGMSIAANKIPGVRAALAHDPLSARLARQHNDANVLCLGGRIIGETLAAACVEAFIKATFTAGEDDRHRRRVRRIEEMERR